MGGMPFIRLCCLFPTVFSKIRSCKISIARDKCCALFSTRWVWSRRVFQNVNNMPSFDYRIENLKETFFRVYEIAWTTLQSTTIRDVIRTNSFPSSGFLSKVTLQKNLKITKQNSGVLGTIALCFLIIKRYRENSLIRRSWTIWLLDTSKQVVGMIFVHFINVLW